MSDLVASFQHAVECSDAAALRQVLADPEVKARVNDPLFSFDRPAITIAAANGKRDIIDALLEAGADINARSTWWAGSFGVLDHDTHAIVPYLIERGANVDAHAAARHRMIGRLRELLDADPQLVHARGGDGQTPLHVAGSLEIAKLLVERGADINIRDIDHESTPAQYLVRQRPEVVRFLIERGCETDILLAAAVGNTDLVGRHLDENPELIRARVTTESYPMKNPKAGGTIYIWTLGLNKSAHQIAREFGHANVLEVLRERSPEDLVLAEMCMAGEAEAVRAKIAADPEKTRTLARSNPGLLSDAAQNNNTEAVGLMLACGWPVEGDGLMTPLHWASWHGNAAMVREILKCNPPLEHVDPEHGGTPLGWAEHGAKFGWYRATGDYAAVREALLKAGAKPVS